MVKMMDEDENYFTFTVCARRSVSLPVSIPVHACGAPTALCVTPSLTLIRDAACCACGACWVVLVWVGLL
ncbi:unnamed protein product [Ectocarpus sp. 6 AP-2014]